MKHGLFFTVGSECLSSSMNNCEEYTTVIQYLYANDSSSHWPSQWRSRVGGVALCKVEGSLERSDVLYCLSSFKLRVRYSQECPLTCFTERFSADDDDGGAFVQS